MLKRVSFFVDSVEMSRKFPVSTCCLLLPHVWDYEVRVPCDCLKLFVNFQVELEKLNAATDEINKLELELDVSRYPSYTLSPNAAAVHSARSTQCSRCFLKVKKSKFFIQCGMKKDFGTDSSNAPFSIELNRLTFDYRYIMFIFSIENSFV